MTTVKSVEEGLRPNEADLTCSNCGEVWDYHNYTVTGSIDVSRLDIDRICPTIDSGFVIHVRGPVNEY